MYSSFIYVGRTLLITMTRQQYIGVANEIEERHEKYLYVYFLSIILIYFCVCLDKEYIV